MGSYQTHAWLIGKEPMLRRDLWEAAGVVHDNLLIGANKRTISGRPDFNVNIILGRLLCACEINRYL